MDHDPNPVSMERELSLKPTNEVNVKLPVVNGDYPILITPKTAIDFFEWSRKHKEEIIEALIQYGALLFKGFEVGGAQQFDDLFSGITDGAMEYKNPSSPRKKVFENVYTSTTYPKDLKINMHTESSYSKDYVRTIAFYCRQPAGKGGETPIADERKLLKHLSPSTLDKFREKKVMYVRNVMTGAGLDWKVIYQTEDKEVVNQLLQKNNVDYEWVSDDHLRLKWILPAFQIHPITEQELWFNHMYFYHKSQYNPEVLEFFEEEDLPFTSYYGDGSPIESSVIQEIRNFYEQHSIIFQWEKDDLLLLDNMMFSHGRNSYDGERSILAAMSHPLSFS